MAGAQVRVRAGGVLTSASTSAMPALVLAHRRRACACSTPAGHRVAGLDSRADRPDLPLVAGEGAEAARARGAGADRCGRGRSLPDLRGLVRVGERRWDVVLDRRQRILLPESEPVAALDQVIALHKRRTCSAATSAIVDMRNPRRPTLRLGDAALDEIRRLRGDSEGPSHL